MNIRFRESTSDIPETAASPAVDTIADADLVKLLDAHKDGKADNSRKIWTVYMFLVWYGVYFND